MCRVTVSFTLRGCKGTFCTTRSFMSFSTAPQAKILEAFFALIVIFLYEIHISTRAAGAKSFNIFQW